jgi:hypothetical protein
MRKFDGVVKYYYEITSKQPMKRTYEKKKIGINELNNIVTSFLKVLDSSIEYLLNPNDFILNPEFIYMNIETSQIYFCYMPGYETDISKNFNELTLYILDKIDHEDKQAVATAYELYRQTLSDNYCLRDILNTIKSEEDNTQVEQKEESTYEEKILNNNKKIEYKKENEEGVKLHRIYIKPKNIVSGIVVVTAAILLLYFMTINLKMNIELDSDIILKIVGGFLIVLVIGIYTFAKKHQMKKEKKEEDSLFIVREEEISSLNKIKIEPMKKESSKMREIEYKKEVLNKDMIDDTNRYEYIKKDFETQEKNNLNETYGNTVLLACKSSNRRLIASKEKFNSFEIVEKSFLIGKMEKHVDGIINDNLVSRIHAEIKNEGGKFFLTDLNSTNGTFHNERRLEANETVEIQPEDMVRFATAEYVFR